MEGITFADVLYRQSITVLVHLALCQAMNDSVISKG